MLTQIENRLHPLFTPETAWGRPLRCLIAILYTAALTLLLEQSSAQPVLGPIAPKEYDLAWDILLTCCHIIGFSLLVLVVWGALVTTPASSRWSLIAAVVFALIFGFISEILQSLVPDRSVSWFDLLVNWSVSLAAAYFIKVRLSPLLLNK